jgi:hypothetical protein
MANTTITPTWVSKDTAMFWQNSIRLIGQADRGYGKEWQNLPEGAKIGYTIQQRVPTAPTVSEGQALQIQPYINQTVPISLTHQLQVACGWSTADDTVVIEEVQDRWTRPAGKSLGAKCDALFGVEVYKSVYNTIGTPGAQITDNLTFMNGVAKLANIGAAEDLSAVLDPKAMAAIVSANFAIFNLPGGNRDFKTGQFSGEQFGVDEWYQDPFMPTHTTGTFTASTPVVSGANQTGSTLTISGMGTYALVAGDTFKIAGLNSVNPVGKNDTGDLAEFSLSVAVSGSSTATLTFTPPIILSGPLQTVVAAPANGAAITFTGATGTVGATLTATSSKQSLIFNPSAFAFVNAPLAKKLAGAEVGSIRDAEAKVSMRYVEQYNIQTDQEPRRIDMLVGNAAVQPYFALRCFGA